MPHDVNGKVLQTGDKVVIRGKVTQIFASENYCNCSVELDLKMPPDSATSVISAVNTRQLEKEE